MSFTSSNNNGAVFILEFGKDPATGDANSLNPLSRPTRHAIYKQLQDWETTDSVSAVVLMGRGGRNFSAGADLTEFTQHRESKNNDIDEISLTDLVHYIESYPKPIIAAIRGVALGGGLELALACHYRICTPQASLGLPEVHVGVIPGAGGTQRLPRLIGIHDAIAMIITGTPVSGTKAMQLGLVNGLCPTNSDLTAWATQWAELAAITTTRSENARLPRLCDVILNRTEVELACEGAFQKYKLPSIPLGGHGVHSALVAIRASATGIDFAAGMQVEQEMFWETMTHPQGRARRHAFFAVRMAQKSDTAAPAALSSHALLHSFSGAVTVGVVGAGLMGSGIALVLLQAGFTVRLVDINDAAVQKGVQFIQKNVASLAKKGGSRSKENANAIAARLKPSTALQDLKDCHLVVEAVLENMKVKHQVFQTLDQITPPGALLLSNTSTLSIDTIASVLTSSSSSSSLSTRRSSCAGWHFFSPAHKMQLVEIVVGKETSPITVGVLQQLTKRIGKIGVVVGNCHGFVGNRMVAPYTGEAAFLVAGCKNNPVDDKEEMTTTIESVDVALTNLHGMKMGPFAMSDLAGNDIGYYIRKEQGFTRDLETGVVGPNRGSRRYTELVDEMVTKLGRLGQKVGKGWYDYDPKIGNGRVGIPSVELAEFIRVRYDNRRSHVSTGASAIATPREFPTMDAKSIIERVLFPLVNEGFKILEENMAQRPSDIDVVYIYGYGWPVWRGGPMYWADHEVGLFYMLQKLRKWYTQYPGSDWFRPSQLLERCVRDKVTLEEYYKEKEKNRSKHCKNARSKL